MGIKTDGFGRMMNDPLIRISGESKRGNQALRDYALMGAGRTLRSLHERYYQQQTSGGLAKPPTINLRTLFDWSQKFSWQNRVAVFDADVQYRARVAHIEGVQEMNERHVASARNVRDLIMKRLQQWQEHGIPRDAKFKDVVHALVEASKLERLAMGEATQRVDLYTRVRELAKELGLSATEEAEAVAAAERIIKGGS
ncbi:MAG: hypothetical protein V3V32_04370 [Dehalococcoidia bacterium]